MARLQQFFADNAYEIFSLQKAETIQQLGAETLEGVLRSRELKSDTLERYSERFALDKETMTMWEAELCRIDANAQQRVGRTCAQGFGRAQEFFAKFADEIVQLQKQNLRDVVMSNQAKSYAERMGAKIFLSVIIVC